MRPSDRQSVREHARLRRKMGEAAVLPPGDLQRREIEAATTKEGKWAEQEWVETLRSHGGSPASTASDRTSTRSETKSFLDPDRGKRTNAAACARLVVGRRRCRRRSDPLGRSAPSPDPTREERGSTPWNGGAARNERPSGRPECHDGDKRAAGTRAGAGREASVSDCPSRSWSRDGPERRASLLPRSASRSVLPLDAFGGGALAFPVPPRRLRPAGHDGGGRFRPARWGRPRELPGQDLGRWGKRIRARWPAMTSRFAGVPLRSRPAAALES